MRYYRVFQVEAWDRDLVVSLYVHIGADRGLLYFECTPCVLPPIRDSYRVIDRLAPSGAGAWLDALGSLVNLPVSIVPRLRHAFRPAARAEFRGWEISSLRYGARFSIRERAAEDDLTEDYLKARDFTRYLTIMQDRVFSATTEFLRSRGISSATFEEKVRLIQNSYYDQRFSNNIGSVLGGSNSFTAGGTPSPDSSSGRPEVPA